jgi:3-hydroxyacyl-CoA dehydrogenase
MANPEIRTIAVIGCGTIGASWASAFLAAGLSVQAWDPDPAFHERLAQFITAAWPDLQALGAKTANWRERLTLAGDLPSALRGADWVQESGPEQLALKQELFGELARLTPSHAILASSSTALMPSDIQARCPDPARVVVAHPFNPPHLVPLVEVVGGTRTTDQTIQRALAFFKAIGKAPIHLKKELPGHLANRLQAALYREAVHLVASGAASVADVDAAVTNGPGLRWAIIGPHLTYHLAGGKGGIAEYFEKLGPSQQARWADLGTPKLDAHARTAIAAGVADEVAAMKTPDLVPWRDRQLLQILKIKRES